MTDPSLREPDGPAAQKPPPEALPNVTPPNASFILQLFLIPMVIVTIIVLVWMGFSWLAHLGTNPEDLATEVERLNDGSWQRALTLADLLRNPRYDYLKDDEQLASRLANVLQAQLKEGDLDKHRVNLRLYLARALGEFRTPVVLPALVEAAQVERDAQVERTLDPRSYFPKEIDVRRAAVEAMAVLAGEESLGPQSLRDDRRVMEALLAASRERATPDPNDDRALLRQTAAFALGVVGGEEALDRLEFMMLNDPYPNARYNATAGLARNGDARAVPGLVEMLDPENREAVASEKTPEAQSWKRGLIMMNALRAAKELERRNPHADLTPVYAAVDKLLQPHHKDAVHLEVREAAQDMAKTKAGA